MLKKASFKAFFLLILSGCAAPTCPALHSWTIPEQMQIAAEHNQLPQDSILRGVLQDYERMRLESK